MNEYTLQYNSERNLKSGGSLAKLYYRVLPLVGIFFQKPVSRIHLYNWFQKSVPSSSCTFFQSPLQIHSSITPHVFRPCHNASTGNILNMQIKVSQPLQSAVLCEPSRKPSLPFRAKQETEKIVIKMIRFISIFSSGFPS